LCGNIVKVSSEIQSAARISTQPLKCIVSDYSLIIAFALEAIAKALQLTTGRFEWHRYIKGLLDVLIGDLSVLKVVISQVNCARLNIDRVVRGI
jgi:hypothetical protein